MHYSLIAFHDSPNVDACMLWSAVVNRWYHLPEYQVLDKSKIIREVKRGRKEMHGKVTDSAIKARKKKIDKTKNKLLRESLG